MRVFEIYDTSKRAHSTCAVLTYDEEKRRAIIRINEGVKPEELPFLLGMFAESGQRTLDHAWSMRWVAERVPPAGRQNIGEILRANGLDEYDEIELLARNRGRSSQDDFQVREVKPEVEYAFVRLDEGDGGDTGFSTMLAQVGSELAHARREAGLTQGELAEKTGLAQAAISRIERGKGNPTFETLVLLARSVGCELEVSLAGHPSSR